MSEENIDNKSKIAEREEEILKFWKENGIFEKTLVKSSPKGEFVFYEGPPTANGRPGIHHLLARAFKDVIPRYKTMQGFRVQRKAGWDTHGLPVELEVEKELGISSKKEIEQYGIEKFNKKCRDNVWKYIDEWQNFTERTGFWVNQKDPYITYNPRYIESLWWAIKEVHKKNLLYKDYKVVPWCPRCGTGLSSHELAQGYKEVKDTALTVKFELEDEPNTFLLAWTTTPWTLLGNVALAVNPDIIYVKIKKEEQYLILAKERLSHVGEGLVVESEFKGKELVGQKYKPPFTYLANETNLGGRENAWKVYAARFVTTDEGTGVVHTAVMYGQDDFELGNEIGLPKKHVVGEDGKFIVGTGDFSELFVKDDETDVAIIKDLHGKESPF